MGEPVLLHEIFESQALLHRERIALDCDGELLTYGELDRRAGQLARFLRKSGVGRGDKVAFLLPRSADVYVTLLGILKAGAAYVPLDPELPAERVELILSDCRPRALVTTRALASRLSGFAPPFSGTVITIDEQLAEIESCPPASVAPGAQPEDLCYIIYTSGTTGRPKGVELEHRSVSHLVQREAELFGITPDDRVFQGFSIAFDASVEEIWLAFCAGACLVVGSREMVHSGPDLSRLLTRAGVTVLSCVPTLLLMTEDDIPTLRLLILGGEVCPPQLVARWWKPGRRVVNTYGPTEATVIATSAECFPGRPVTIGRPLPGYLACIVDGADGELRPVPDGTVGELCLGGIGLARGYLGQPELTARKFVVLAPDGEVARRFYRTGDLARVNAEGQLEYHGRSDTQVKIRGYRIELSEIESVLLECPELRAAAVRVHEPVAGVQQLVAYAVPREAGAFDAAALLARLRARLPCYMVPACIESLPDLPTLTSGKVDRARLPPPRGSANGRETAAGSGRVFIPPRSPLEKTIAAVWEPFFTHGAPRPISVDDDFFTDLGGHSLLAARMLASLRTVERLSRVSLLDIYRHPTIEKLALALALEAEAAHESAEETVATPSPGFAPVPWLRHFACGLAQAISLLFILSVYAIQWLAPYLVFTLLHEEDYDLLTSVLGGIASLIPLSSVMLLVPIAVKWLVIGRYKPGRYPLWGLYYFRWWLVTTLESAVPIHYLKGTPLLSLYYRLMGARIGREVHLASNNGAIYDLLSVGDGSSINADANFLGYTVGPGYLELGRVTLGKGCFAGTRSVLGLDSSMGDGSMLEDLSLLPEGGHIPAGQCWAGSPARPVSRVPEEATLPPPPIPSLIPRGLVGALYFLGLSTFPILVTSAIFPGVLLMNHLNYMDPYYWYLLLSPGVALSFVMFLTLEIAALKWLLLGRVKPGQHSLHGFFHFRHWFVDQTMALSLDVLGPLYATLYLLPWYRLLGARIGKGAEVSTASFISPDLLSIDDESFIADNVSLGAPRVKDGTVTLGPNHVGRRSFIGNNATLPPGSYIGESVLIGCLSIPPGSAAGGALRPHTSWMGSPSIFLPQRQESTEYSEASTFQPSLWLRLARASIELFRIIAPSTGFIIFINLLFSALLILRDYYSVGETLLFIPPLYLTCAIAAALATIAAKWLLVFRYRPGDRPLWCTFVWRNEAVNALHWHLAVPFGVNFLVGTPFICWYFRLLGARIGRRVYLNTTDLCEFDLTTIGDEAACNAECTLQTHLFEDRVMKMSHVTIGPRCVVGAGSLVLYDSRMEEGSRLGDLSLLMKGETLAPWTTWCGSPAQAAMPSVEMPRATISLRGA